MRHALGWPALARGLALLALTTACTTSGAPRPPWSGWQPFDRPGQPRMSIDARGRWAVVCRSTKSAERRWGPNGTRTWSQAPVLYLGDRPGIALDDYLGADRVGHHLAIVREGVHYVVDTSTGKQTPVDGFESLSFDGVLFRRRVVEGRSTLVARWLDDSKEVSLDLPPGRLRTWKELVVVAPVDDETTEKSSAIAPSPTSPPFNWCGPWQGSPDAFDAPKPAPFVWVGSTRTGLVRRVQGFVAPPLPGEVVLERSADGELVVEDPADASVVARVPPTCRATPLATHRTTLLVGCRDEGNLWHPWIFDRSGGRDLGGRTALAVQTLGDDLVLLGEPSGPRLLVDVPARTATPFDDGDVLRFDHDTMVVLRASRLWVSRRGEPARLLAPPVGELHVDVQPTLGAWPMVSFGPFVVDLETETLHGVSPRPHAAVAPDGRVLTLRGEALHRDFVAGERLLDVLQWTDAPLPSGS